MKILITAGPTREYLDPVRFISNGSSGKLGYALAQTARDRGHKVILISGPVALTPPKGVKVAHVETGLQMHGICNIAFHWADAVIMAAAVCDYRPKKAARHKLAKLDSLTLELVKTPDILADLGAKKRGQVLIGFALQDKQARARAKEKLLRKNCDAIVLNRPAAIGADRGDIEILVRGQPWQAYPSRTKKQQSLIIIKLAEQLLP